MKDKIIDCICEITKAYSLESEWTPELEKEIRKVSIFSESKLRMIAMDYSPSSMLFHLDVKIKDSYFQDLRIRFREDTTIRWEIVKRYNL
jgi:hypothetical protein